MTNTDAYRNFEANLDEFLAMQRLLLPVELQRVMGAVKTRVRRQVNKGTAASMKVISAAVSDLSNAVDGYVRGRTMLMDWTAVVLVALVQAYVEDGLVLIATKNLGLLRTADAIDKNLVFELSSIEELRAELRKQWAKKTLAGGPKKWLPCLRDMGHQVQKKDAVVRLQHLWDTRSLIVHGRGIATTAYLRPQTNHSIKPGDRVHVGTDLLKWWMRGVEDFVDPLDQFFLTYGAKTSRS